MKINIIMLLAGLLFVASCRKKDPPAVEETPPVKTGQVTMSFRNMADTAPLVLHSGMYVNEHGDSFTVSTYKYYISNISLAADNGKTFPEPESYHLVDESVPASLAFSFSGIPEGTYTKLKFLIGVDKARNTSGAQTGALDPIHGMFWDWNTGYIMAKMEGNSPQAVQSHGLFEFHMGGFSGQDSVLRWVTLTLPTPLVITEAGKPVVYLNSNVLEWFRTPHIIDFASTSILTTTGPVSAQMADNYADMFTVDFVEQH